MEHGAVRLRVSNETWRQEPALELTEINANAECKMQNVAVRSAIWILQFAICNQNGHRYSGTTLKETPRYEARHKPWYASWFVVGRRVPTEYKSAGSPPLS
jgi:hypothetical protein